MKMLNIACGDRYHLDWVNIDFNPVSKNVKKVNILSGLPFENEYFDFVYCSHFLEHLTPEQADFVLREVYRVLKKGGILRVVVPDLENICREYLRILDQVLVNENYKDKYEWIVIELIDQLVRVNSGGMMAKVYNKVRESQNKALAEYIFHRVGEKLLDGENQKVSFLAKIRKITIAKIVNGLTYLYLRSIRLLIPKNLRNLVFINTSIGERHQWMYDKYSLRIKLESCGFRDIKILSYNHSQIPNFNSYLLDINEDGTPRKGVSSLYMEATK